MLSSILNTYKHMILIGRIMKHSILRAVVANVNLGDVYVPELDIGITLNVNGVLVSGIIISRKEFYNTDQNFVLKPLYDALIEQMANDGEVFDETELENIRLIHLKDAAYMTGSQRIPSTGGMTVAIDIDDIASYSMGQLKIEQ